MAKQRRSRSDNSQVQSILNLLSSPRTTKRSGVRNPTKKLTAKQYEKFLTAFNDPKDNSVSDDIKESLRFEYSHSKNRFEIRLPNIIEGGIRSLLEESMWEWRADLRKSNDARYSDIVDTFASLANGSLTFPDTLGAKETKSPDWGVHHRCKSRGGRRCRYPTLVLEVGWTQTRGDLQEKAEAYINGSKSEIRTVIAVHMYNMYLAERRNEDELRRMYRRGEVKGNVSYSYSKDESNQTSSASILVWRVGKMEDGTGKVGEPEEMIFRDSEGNAIQSESLRLPFEDFICASIMNSEEGKLEAPSLEISSDTLCRTIQALLEEYREQRAKVVRETVKEDERKRAEKREKERSSHRKVQK